MLQARTFLFALIMGFAMHNETHALWFEKGAMIARSEYNKFEKEHATYQREVTKQLLAHIPIVDLNNVITSYSEMNFFEFQDMQRKQKIIDGFKLLIKEYQIQEIEEKK